MAHLKRNIEKGIQMKKVKKKKAKKRAKKAKKKAPKKARRRKLKGEVQVRGRSPAAKRPINRQGREILLTDEMLAKMILLWRYGISNPKIVRILGIGVTSLKKWIKENRPVEVIILDDPVNHPKLSRRVVIGLKDLMEHERDNLKASYIQRLEDIIEEARSEGDLKTASANLRWIMEKMLPHVFGDPKHRPEGDPDVPKRVGFPLRPPTLD
jgi:hypothetical protein